MVPEHVHRFLCHEKHNYTHFLLQTVKQLSLREVVGSVDSATASSVPLGKALIKLL